MLRGFPLEVTTSGMAWGPTSETVFYLIEDKHQGDVALWVAED